MLIAVLMSACLQSGGNAPSVAANGESEGGRFSRINIKVFLGGPIGGDYNFMYTRLKYLLPTTDPYGLGTVSQNIQMINGVVDWIKIELRDTEAPYAIVHQFAGLLMENGRVVDVDGTSYPKTKAEGTFMVYIKHRNHFPVRATNNMTLALDTVAEGDYSKFGSFFELSGFAPQYKICIGACADNIAITQGQVNSDCNIDNTDYNIIRQASQDGLTGYQRTDLNFDGVVDLDDEYEWYYAGRSSIDDDARCAY